MQVHADRPFPQEYLRPQDEAGAGLMVAHSFTWGRTGRHRKFRGNEINGEDTIDQDSRKKQVATDSERGGRRSERTSGGRA